MGKNWPYFCCVIGCNHQLTQYDRHPAEEKGGGREGKYLYKFWTGLCHPGTLTLSDPVYNYFKDETNENWYPHEWKYWHFTLKILYSTPNNLNSLVYSNLMLTWTKIDFYWIIPSYIYCSVILPSVTQSNFFPSDQYFCIILLLITQTVFKACNKSKKQKNQQSSVVWNTGFILKQLCILFLYFFVSKVQIQCPALYINQAFNVLQLNSIIFAGFKILYQNTTVCSRF